jgi:hypothetical protein
MAITAAQRKRLEKKMEALLKSLRDAQAKAATPNALEALKKFADAVDVLVQQRKGAEVTQKLAASSEAVILDEETFGKEPRIKDQKVKAIDDAVKAVFTGAKLIKDKQADIDRATREVSAAKARLKSLLDAVDARTKQLIAAREQVARLQAAAITAKQSTAPDTKVKLADSFCELDAANTALRTMLDEPLKELEDSANEITAATITDAVDREKNALEALEKRTQEKKELEATQKLNEEQRKNAGR